MNMAKQNSEHLMGHPLRHPHTKIIWVFLSCHLASPSQIKIMIKVDMVGAQYLETVSPLEKL